METTGGVDVGRRLFSFQECLGRGGFGEVYRAQMTTPSGLRSDVAVKVLRASRADDGQALARLRDEGRLLARLDHPTILRVHDLAWIDGCVALVTEYIEGQDLGACLTGVDPLQPRALVEVVGQVAAALDAAWDGSTDGRPLRLVHRDVKPANIRVSRHGQVKLLDFGIARCAEAGVTREARTATDMIVGSPGYMAPERFFSSDADPASDVFALGCVLFEGIAGWRLFADLPFAVQAGLVVQTSRFHQHVEERICAARPRLTPEVEVLLRRMLAYAGPERPLAREVVSACEALGDHLPGANLARWCRARAWPEAGDAEGPLVGREITEGTLARAHPPVAAAPTPTGRGRSGVWIAVGLLSVLAFGGSASIVALGGGVAAMWWGSNAADPSAVPPASTAPPPGEGAVAPPAAVPAPEDESPVHHEAVAAPPVAAPEEDAPTGARSPEPPVEKGEIARRSVDRVPVDVAIRGDMTVSARVDGVDRRLPADLVPGDYALVVSIRGGPPVELAQRVVVVVGERPKVVCDAGFGRCRVDVAPTP